MSQISRHKLKPELEDRIMQVFVDVIANSKSSLRPAAFIELFLTPTEKVMLSKRVAIAILVKRGYSYDLIKSYLNVSQSTIAGIVNQLKTSSPSNQDILDKVIKNKDIQKVVGEFEYNLRSLIPPKGRDWTIWRKNLENDKRLLEIPL